MRRPAASGLLLALLAASCGTNDNDGLGLGVTAEIASQKAVRVLLLAADSTTDFQAAAQPDNAAEGPALALGTQSGLFARSLLRFDATVLPAGIVLDSASVRIFFEESLGAPGSLSVVVHRVTAAWEEVPLPSPFPAIDAPTDTLTLAGDLEEATVVNIRVDAMAQLWLDDPAQNQGVALVPADSADLLLEYFSRNSARPPTLQVHWTSAGAGTTAAVPIRADATLLIKTGAFVTLSGQPRRLTVGRGIPSAALLRFPLPNLGPRATVHRAVLTLFPDAALSHLNEFSMRFQRVQEEPWKGDSTVVSTVVHALSPVAAGQDSVRFELGGLVTAQQREGNFGMLMRAHDNRPDTDYIRFHAPDSEDPSRAPRLDVWYTPGEEDLP